LLTVMRPAQPVAVQAAFFDDDGASTRRSPSIIEAVAAYASAHERMWERKRVEDVLWIEGAPVALAIVLCPRGDAWLSDDLRDIQRGGVDVLVSLLEPDEAEWLGLGQEAPLAGQLGIRFLSYPIPDMHVPAHVATFRSFVSGLVDRLGAGERIGLHCRGSIGRAPLTAACTLIHLGWKAQDALKAIRTARGYPIPDTEEQLRWILGYKAQP
jgi:hypothetical protein